MIRLRELGKKRQNDLGDGCCPPPVFSRQGWFPHPRIMFIFEETHQKSKELICLNIESECIPEIPWFISNYKTKWGLFTPFTDALRFEHLWRDNGAYHLAADNLCHYTCRGMSWHWSKATEGPCKLR